MSQKRNLWKREKFVFTNYKQIETVGKFIKFLQILIFGAILLIGVAENAQAESFLIKILLLFLK